MQQLNCIPELPLQAVLTLLQYVMHLGQSTILCLQPSARSGR